MLGLSGSDADALEQALGVKSVRELADNKYVRRALAIVHLANEKRSRDLYVLAMLSAEWKVDLPTASDLA